MYSHASGTASIPQQRRASNATHCSLRGENRLGLAHPLRQNPPSIAGSLHDYAFDDVPLAPPPSALTSRPSHYDPHDPSSHLQESPRPLSGHQRSLTGTFLDNCRPLVNRVNTTLQQHTSKTSFHSPSKSLASFIPSKNTTPETQAKTRAGNKIFGDWFNGSSAPVNLGVGPPSPRRERPEEEDYSESESGSEVGDSEEDEEEPTMMAGIFNRTPTRTMTETPPKRPSNLSKTASAKFGWLLNTQKSAVVPSTVPPQNYHNPSDELLNLNISQSLFPDGPVDPLDPSSFHDLLSTAEKLITRYQSSYRALSNAVHDARAEQSAQEDELDEAETKNQHLKMQLETMAARAAEQEAQMQKLAQELALERQMRREEEEARKKSLALVRGPGCAHTECQSPGSPRRKRTSNSELSVDSGFESEADSEAASIFSRAYGARSPTDTLPSSAASFAEADGHFDLTPTPKKPQLVHRPSTYEKVLGGMHGKPQQEKTWGCSNCEGGSQSNVWGQLRREREENRVLKDRVQKLEDGIDGALNVVDGPWGF